MEEVENEQIAKNFDLVASLLNFLEACEIPEDTQVIWCCATATMSMYARCYGNDAFSKEAMFRELDDFKNTFLDMMQTVEKQKESAKVP